MKCPQCSHYFKAKRGKKFCKPSCRVAHWHFVNAGQRVLADHEKRLRKIERAVGIKKERAAGLSKG